MADRQQKEGKVVDEPESGGATTAVAPVRERVKPKRDAKQLPPYKVLLHNDDVNTFDHVIKTILMLTTMPPQEALVKTIEAHESGVVLLLVTHRERAELYEEQFRSRSLTVTIEPAEY